jgi:hypothetical protein
LRHMQSKKNNLLTNIWLPSTKTIDDGKKAESIDTN